MRVRVYLSLSFSLSPPLSLCDVGVDVEVCIHAIDRAVAFRGLRVLYECQITWLEVLDLSQSLVFQL